MFAFGSAAFAETTPATNLVPVTGQQVVDTIKAELITHFNLMGDLDVEITGPWTPPEKLASNWQIEV